jgi:hypothetical protein
VNSIASRVLFEPVPAITATRPPTTSVTCRTTSTCSAGESVADSPVLPHGTSPSTPHSICHSISRAIVSRSSERSARKGVTSAV